MRIDKHFLRIYFTEMGSPWSPGFSLGFGPLNLLSVSGLAIDSMQILGYSNSQKLLYDEANTQAFYLFTIFLGDFNNDFNNDFGPPKGGTTLYRVSPLFARNWLVFSGAASNWVYNPFGSSPYSNFSNVA